MLSKKRLLNLLKTLFAVGIVYWVVANDMLDWQLILELSRSNQLLILMSIQLVQILFNAMRWYYLVRGQGLMIPFGKSLSLTFISLLFNLITPGGAGGDFFKGYYLLKMFPKQKMLAAMGLVMDRFFGLLAVAFLCVLAFAIDGVMLLETKKTLFTMGLFATAVFMGLIGVLVLAMFTRFEQTKLAKLIFNKLWGGHLIESFFAAFAAYAQHKQSLLIAFVTALVSQMTIITTFWLVAGSMGVKASIESYLFVVPIGLFASMLPLTPGGVGVGQVAFMTLFNLYLGKETALGATAFSVYQLTLLLWGSIGLIAYQRQGVKAEEAQKETLG